MACLDLLDPSSGGFMAGERSDLLPGTLDLLVLRTLAAQSMHGYGIVQHIARLSQDVLRVEEGSLYPALQRLLLKGWLKAEWRQTPTNRRARYYELTRPGRKQLALEVEGFETIVAAIHRVLRQE
ncbi:MAG: PadR family transcriptional regulator [Gemmatimonadota bacterium]